jgi:hypothetical protein
MNRKIILSLSGTLCANVPQQPRTRPYIIFNKTQKISSNTEPKNQPEIESNRIDIKGPKRQIQAKTKQCLESHILASLYLAAARGPRHGLGKPQETGGRPTSFQTVESEWQTPWKGFTRQKNEFQQFQRNTENQLTLLEERLKLAPEAVEHALHTIQRRWCLALSLRRFIRRRWPWPYAYGSL